MRILQITSCLKRNGTETFIMNLFRNINREEFMFDFLIFSSEKEGFYDEIISLGGKVFSLPARKYGFKKYLSHIKSFFQLHAHEYDAIHWHGSSFSSIAPIYYAKKYGIPTIILHSHSSNCADFHNLILHKINKFFIPRLGTHFLACSDKAIKWAFGNSSVCSKAKVITNGLPLDKFAFDPVIREQVRKKLNLENSFVVGHIGAFNPIKNHSFLLQVFKEILGMKKNAVLICIGEGDLFNKTIELARTLEIEKNVMFLGRRDDVAQLLQTMDIMIMPSLFEGLPYALIEAQASNLPVFASASISEYSKITDNFFYIPLGKSPLEWANIISNYFDFQRTGVKMNDRLLQFSIENTTAEISAIYKKAQNEHFISF